MGGRGARSGLHNTKGGSVAGQTMTAIRKQVGDTSSLSRHEIASKVREAKANNAAVQNINTRRLQASGNNNEVLQSIKKTEIRSVDGRDVRIAGSSAYWRAEKEDNAITVSKGDREWTIARTPYRTGKKWVATEKSWSSRGSRVVDIGESDSVDTLINRINKKLK